MMGIAESANKSLLVVGNDDKHVIYALTDAHNITRDFTVVDCEGVEHLFNSLSLKIVKPNQCIGVLVDADENAEGRWQRISDILRKAGIDIPLTIHRDGIVIVHEPKNLKIGIWIMPDNSLNGMLEDFMRLLIPEDDVLLPVAHEAIKKIEKQEIQKYPSAHRAKAIMHTWLAWQETPGKPLGQSISRRYLDIDSEVCLRFVNWIKRTFAD